jgi:hypothetical protein
MYTDIHILSISVDTISVLGQITLIYVHVCQYVCVCMYISCGFSCIYTYFCVYIFTFVYICMHEYVHRHTYTLPHMFPPYVCVQKQTPFMYAMLCVHTHAYMCNIQHTQTHIATHAHITQVCVSDYKCARAHMHICVVYGFVFTHTLTHERHTCTSVQLKVKKHAALLF